MLYYLKHNIYNNHVTLFNYQLTMHRISVALYKLQATFYQQTNVKSSMSVQLNMNAPNIS